MYGLQLPISKKFQMTDAVAFCFSLRGEPQSQRRLRRGALPRQKDQERFGRLTFHREGSLPTSADIASQAKELWQSTLAQRCIGILIIGHSHFPGLHRALPILSARAANRQPGAKDELDGGGAVCLPLRGRRKAFAVPRNRCS